MYKIMITRQKRKDAVTYLKKMPTKAIKDSLIKMRDNLSSVKKLNNLNDYKNYLTDIIRLYPLIQIMPPSSFPKFIQKYPNISKLKASDLKEKFYSVTGVQKSFSDLVIYNMRYGTPDMIKSFIPFLEAYGFKTCVYCNQSSIHYYDFLGKKKRTGTLDHFYNKDRYPFLCTSFFNLVPCCADCNGKGMKEERQIGFYPYREQSSEKESPFKFIFKIRSMGKYCSSNDVDIDFSEDPNMGDLVLYKKNKVLQTYKEIFKIVERYNSYKGNVSNAVKREAYFVEAINNTAPSLSNKRLKPLLDPERVKLILDVESLNKEDIHTKIIMKFLLDLKESLGL